MAIAKVDMFTEEELREIVQDCTSYRELVRRLGYAQVGNNHKTIQARLEKYNISIEHFTGVAKGQEKRSESNVFCKNSTATQSTLRRWYKKGNYSEYKCAICGQEPFWNGKELTLTLDHINGCNHDNELSNLRWVCPNCDRQLDTFAGKNTNRENYYNYDKQQEKLQEKVPEEQKQQQQEREGKIPDKDSLLEILIENKGSFTRVGKLFSVTDNSVRKWCKKYDLPYHTSDYQDKKEKRPKIIKDTRVRCIETGIDYSSFSDAARKLQQEGRIPSETKLESAAVAIGRVANGQRATAYGYTWVLLSNI